MVKRNNNYKDVTNIDIYVDVLHSEPLEIIPFQSKLYLLGARAKQTISCYT